MSLRRRLLLTLAPLFIAGLIAVDVATFLSLQSYLVSKADAQLLAVHPRGPPHSPGACHLR
ncbi:MAG: hypothetical protein ABI352_10280 [Candidatus Dormibacter sp.]